MQQIIIYELLKYFYKSYFIGIFIILLSGCSNTDHYNNKKGVSFSIYFNDGITNSPRQIDIVIPKSDDQYFVVLDNPHLNSILLKTVNKIHFTRQVIGLNLKKEHIIIDFS